MGFSSDRLLEDFLDGNRFTRLHHLFVRRHAKGQDPEESPRGAGYTLTH